MLHLLCWLVVANVPPENSDIIAVARPHIDKILLSPKTASYEVTLCKHDRENLFYAAYGTVDSKNVLDVPIRMQWVMLFTIESGASISPVTINLTDASGKVHVAYISEELRRRQQEEQQKQAEAAQKQAEEAERAQAIREQEEREKPKRIWKAYASMIAELEKATSKLPYNSPKRVSQYWKPLAQRNDAFQHEHQLTESSLKSLVQTALDEKWPTEPPSNADAVRTMLRRYRRGR